jgi:hypothetical protein
MEAQGTRPERHAALVEARHRDGRHPVHQHARRSAHGDHRLLAQDRNLKLAQLYARHADISTTANVCGHLDVGDLEAALERIHDS